MLKWFEEVDQTRPGIVSSQVRLMRNWSQYAFPSQLSDKEKQELLRRLEVGLENLGSVDGKNYVYRNWKDMNEVERKALEERRVFQSAASAKKNPVIGLILSQEEDTSIVLNDTEHIRLQITSPGLHLEELWERCDQMDDYINARFSYAFDKKYGYLTAYPTYTGTGLRASAVVHLPTLSLGKKFNGLVAEMGRFGAAVRGVYGEDNYGSLYEVSNQKTLGVTEKEILDLVSRAAGQLLAQERQVRKATLEKRRLEYEDEVYKSYGVLKYARRMSAKDAMIFLSQIMAGITDGILETEGNWGVYRLMLGIQPANLQMISQRPMEEGELEEVRAAYIRKELPELR